MNQDTVVNLASLKVPMRIRQLLHRLASEHGVADAAGTRIEVPLTHSDIASLVGSRISACGSKGLASRQCFSVGRPYRAATSISRSHAAFSESAYQRSVSVSSTAP